MGLQRAAAGANCADGLSFALDTHLENNHFGSLVVCKEGRVKFPKILCIKNFQPGRLGYRSKLRRGVVCTYVLCFGDKSLEAILTACAYRSPRAVCHRVWTCPAATGVWRLFRPSVSVPFSAPYLFLLSLLASAWVNATLNFRHVQN